MNLIPTELLEPGSKLTDLILFIYGPPGIGKSSLAAEAGALFIATEEGLKSLRRYQVSVDNWETFRDACKELRDTKPKHFKFIAIDTADNLWKFCIAYVCKKHNIDHPSDQEWGKGWDLCKTEWVRVITRLSMLGYGLWFISHSTQRSFQTRTRKRDKIVPTIPNSARGVILPIADIQMYLSMQEIEKDGEVIERRVAQFKPSESVETKEKTGRLPDLMDMGDSAQEFWTRFQRHFEKGGNRGRRTPKSA
jgi:hypothetical protein